MVTGTAEYRPDNLDTQYSGAPSSAAEENPVSSFEREAPRDNLTSTDNLTTNPLIVHPSMIEGEMLQSLLAQYRSAKTDDEKSHCIESARPFTEAIQSLGIKNLTSPVPYWFSSGEPTREQLQQLAANSIEHVICLQPQSELTQYQASDVLALNMTYDTIPVDGMDGVTFANAEKLQQLIRKYKFQPTLLHCACGNRNGALIALITYTSVPNCTVEHAALRGVAWGLRQYTPDVIQLLQKAERSSSSTVQDLQFELDVDSTFDNETKTPAESSRNEPWSSSDSESDND